MKWVLEKGRRNSQSLNVLYGDERLVTDLGGYILLDIEEIHTFITQHSTLIPEYIESFEGQDLNQYVEVLFMLSSDDHVGALLVKRNIRSRLSDIS